MANMDGIKPSSKKTIIKYIPKEWKAVSLFKVADIIFSNVDKKLNSNEVPVLLCNYMDVYKNRRITSAINFMCSSATDSEIEKYRLRIHDVIITKDSETSADIAVSSIISEEIPNLICGYHLAILRSHKDKLDGEYLNKLFEMQFMRYYFAMLSNGVTRFGLTSGVVKKAIIPLPPLPEQNKISEILSTWDKAIEQTQQLIEAKKRRKKALMQQFFSGNTKLKGFEKEVWETVPLERLVSPVSRPVPKPEKPYLSIGLRSHCKGTFHKIIGEPEKIMMDTLYSVEREDLIVNITFAWEGAIAFAGAKDSGGLVSHRFPTYRLKSENADPDFFRNLILTKKFIWDLDLISPGGAGRNRVMDKKDFLKIRVNVPSIKSQKKIGQILSTTDNEITQLEKKLTALEQQKRGLMQKLLTGEIRVKT